MTRFPKALKISLFAFGGLAGILVLAALALFLVDVESYKPRVEAMASSRLGMDVTVEGQLHIGIIPELHVTLEHVRMRNRGSEIAFVEKADLAIEFLSLLRQNLRFGNIALKRARLSIELGRDGKYNFEKPPGSEAAFPALDIPQVSFAELIVAYVNKGSDDAFEARSCNGELSRVRHPGKAKFLSRLSLSGQFTCRELAGKKALISDVRFSVEATEGVFDFKPFTMRAFGGEGSGALRVDRSRAVPVVQLDYALRKFRIEEYFKTLLPGKSASGPMDFSITLAMRGPTRGELRRSARGEMSLSGTNLTLAGVDLDKELSRYAASQRFNLFDLTAFVFAGPLGLALTKGTQLASLSHPDGGTTPIRTVVSKWKVEKGVAHASDVAWTTRENRLALHGALDFVDDEFDDVVVALIDSNGCAKVRQRIRGPFGNPVVEKPDVLTAITGPVRKLLDRARELVSDRKSTRLNSSHIQKSRMPSSA